MLNDKIVNINLMSIRNIIVLSLALLLSACATTLTGFTSESPPQTLPLLPVTAAKHPVIGIALGGGATRGFAHIGVLNTLLQNNINPDIVVGTSAGAVTGVLFAGGIRGTKLEEVAQQLQRDQIVDWSYSGRGFIRGDLLQTYVNNLLDNRPIENLTTVFAATATDLENGNLVVFTKGDAGLAARASSAIPGLVSPVTINDRDYVDGGLVSKVPVNVARALGADIVIAVDVSRSPEEHPALDNTVAVMQQAIAIMTVAVLDKDLEDADVIIRPEIGVEPFGTFDMKEQAIKAGEHAASAAIPVIRQLLETQRHVKQKARDVKRKKMIFDTP